MGKIFHSNACVSYTAWIVQKKNKVTDRELYDLERDPLSNENVVFKPDHRSLVEQLHAQLLAGWKQALPE